MLGVILCGGQSKRMGKDKAMLPFESGTWAKNAADKISSLGINVFFSVNAIQYSDYQPELTVTQLIKDNDHLQTGGPLAGVLSVHMQHPEDDLFVLACDMPLMEKEILKELMTVYVENPAADAYLFLNDGEPEPLCAIYTAKGLSYIVHLLNAKELTRHSMKFILEHMHSITTNLTGDKNKYFRNFNTLAELNGL